ncbi:membrane alanyl aminopeptidase [Leptospira ryugenii]|uniref:Aminopeptidase N n=1 Tax=Leptospira ryugenii TaxID=1917863 RepID=A0A2P2DXC8_9LEPT|nr:aminopeptidase N [Leptospira ryugenii]GBF49266.1 membrane alanyl aminopeptidase [Leptospira ryugenii]
MSSSSTELKPHFLEEYTSPLWITPEAKIRFDLDLERTIVRTDYLVEYVGDWEGEALPGVFFHGEGLGFLSLRINGAIAEPLQYHVSEDGLFLRIVPGRSFRLTVENSLSPKHNTALEGLYHSGSMLCTQNEPEGFRKITYSIDRPDNPIRFQVTLSAPKEEFPTLLSNGNLIHSQEWEDGRQEVVWEDPFPKPSYLFAIVAGNLQYRSDQWKTKSGRSIELRIYVEEKNLSKTDFAMFALKEAMRWDEETFGLEYDLDLYMIVAVDDFNMGAMENKGLNLFNSKLVLADKSSATDDTFESILAVVAHEYFHNWTGNRVTLRNWFNLTLKEGLTVFRDQWFTEDKTDPSVKRIKDVLILWEHQFPEDAGPMAHPILPKSYIEMNNFYTVTVYEKGAEVIRMLSHLIGRDTFRKGLQLYLHTYDGQAVTFEEFLSSMEQVSHHSLLQFRNWYHRKGTPTLRVEEKWNPSEGTYQIKIQDSETGELPLVFPIQYALFDQDSKSLDSGLWEMKAVQEEKVWTGLVNKPIFSLLRSYSAPVHLAFERDERELIFLAKQETDGFSKFFAFQKIIFREFRNRWEQNQKNSTSDTIALYKHFIETRETLPKDYLSYLLAFPGLTILADELKVYAFEEIHEIRHKMLQEISSTLRPDLFSVYKENLGSMSSQDRENIGKRRLKNMALSFLFYLPQAKDEVISIALEQQKQANHMSDEIAVLRAFCESSYREKETSIQLFYNKWKADVLSLDLWFSAQVSYGPDALERAQSLVSSSDFNWKNPNRVRSVLSSLARNHLSFHRKDGATYRWLCECLLLLNEINPQIAAQIAKTFQSVRWQDAKRKGLALMALQTVLDFPHLSRDLAEIAGKICKDLENNQS